MVFQNLSSGILLGVSQEKKVQLKERRTRVKEVATPEGSPIAEQCVAHRPFSMYLYVARDTKVFSGMATVCGVLGGFCLGLELWVCSLR